MLSDLIRERLEKKSKLEKAGINPYPSVAKRSLRIVEALRKFNALTEKKEMVYIVGRLMSIRDQGGVIFAHLKDESGKIQICLKKDVFQEFSFYKKIIDRGDFISVGGRLFKTNKGEKTVEVVELAVLAKAIRPIPVEWYGLEEIEARLRKRYLDILLNEELKEMFIKKGKFWDSFRSFLKKEGFREVETPVFESVPGGAEAEPFITHHNALDLDFYLRISLEIPLKKLLVAGFERVFEIGRVFRNEGIDREHLQDYTQLEFYWAYHDYYDLMDFVERLYKYAIKKTCGTLTTKYKSDKIDWSRKWPKLEYSSLFKEETGIDPTEASRRELFDKAVELDIDPPEYAGKGRLIDLIFKKAIRPQIIQPAFLINHPVETSPLAKRHRDNPRLVERFQVLGCGTELGNGFSELNDPVDQRARFEEQMKLRSEGDKEAQRLDEEFLEALEYGMPPAAGFGVSERLFAVLMDRPIRETVIFPLMRPKEQKEE